MTSTKTRPVVFCGPSGAGKSTLLKKLMNEYPNCFAFSVSHTTRHPRPGEVHGKDYYFVSVDEMKKGIDEKLFIEYAQTYGNYYGTSLKAIEDISSSGKICVLDIDTKGVVSVKNSPLCPSYIFIKPPSFEDLVSDRLVTRGTETEDSLKKRLDLANEEMKFCEIPGMFDLVVVNDDIEKAYSSIKMFLQKDIEAVLESQNFT
ncbi:hypothetical protein HELRODRAFT_155295 [Helobdella robusta]|uniref:guanylate kinase n=1 Tax=Helobdella robusta TaxID=6412 RepID=T1ELH8_HELRO|nr:hypothetical protein HELRODRAFT_155295 [Helobdella robusta]ESN93615.1 hypothetical protein HELRODRAFT_155295 [Helobdella robusta]